MKRNKINFLRILELQCTRHTTRHKVYNEIRSVCELPYGPKKCGISEEGQKRKSSWIYHPHFIRMCLKSISLSNKTRSPCISLVIFSILL